VICLLVLLTTVFLANAEPILDDSVTKQLMCSENASIATLTEEPGVVGTLLLHVVGQLKAPTILDAGCGETAWLNDIDLGEADYIGIDIVPGLVTSNRERYGGTSRRFLKRDIIHDSLPKADIIICRDVFNSFSTQDIFKALCNLRRTGAQYLIVSSFLRDVSQNEDVPTKGWRPLNLQHAPFNFGNPSMQVEDGCTRDDSIYFDQILGVWHFDDLFGFEGDRDTYCVPLVATTRAREVFTYIYQANKWNSLESSSGNESSLKKTVAIRTLISRLLKELPVDVVLDAGCGEMHWMSHVDLGDSTYIGVDIVPEIIRLNTQQYGSTKKRFYALDIVNDALPAADIILCRDVMTQFPIYDILKTLCNFRRTGATFLVTTSFLSDVKIDNNVHVGDWHPVNFQQPPFDFPKPYRVMMEVYTDENDLSAKKALMVWNLNDLFDGSEQLRSYCSPSFERLIKMVPKDRGAIWFDDCFGQEHTIAQTWNMPGYISLRRFYLMLQALYYRNHPTHVRIAPEYNIPKKIHQIWIQGEEDIPPHLKELQKSWKLEGWEYILWTDQKIKELSFESKELYESETNPGQKGDIAGYEILRRYGGVYSDIDSELLHPEMLDFFNRAYTFYAGITPLELEVFCIGAGLIGSVPDHQILNTIVEVLPEWVRYRKSFARTGPVLLSRAVEMSIDRPGYTDIIFPPPYFYPLAPSEKHQLQMTKYDCPPEAVTVENWSGSWIGVEV